MTKQSRILDRMVNGKYLLEIKALSADMKKPLTLHAVLTDYDDDGFLYRGKSTNSLEDSGFYVPRAAVAYMKFSKDNLPEDRQVEEKSNVRVFGGVTYNLDKKELSGNGNREFIIGDISQRFLELFFESTEAPVDKRTLSGLQNTDETSLRPLRSAICRLRRVLKKYGLTIFPVRGYGYVLKALGNDAEDS